jgi:hypothetical protein
MKADRQTPIIKIISKDNLKKLVSDAEKKLNRKFTLIDIESLVRYVKKMSPVILQEQINIDSSLSKANNYISDSYIAYISEPKAYDIKEMLKDNMESRLNTNSNQMMDKYKMERFRGGRNEDVEGFSDLSSYDPSTLVEVAKIINRDSLLRDVNILIDSRYQNRSNTDRSRFSFSIVSGTKNKSEGSGTIISSTSIEDIVEIEVFPFSIPYFNDADNYYKKITMSILELSASSIDAYENSQFHFIFDIEKRLNLLYLTPINKVFKFHKPISKINELTIRFGSPLATITFEKDRLQTKTINYSANPMTIEFFEPHNLLTGDIIYINDFETLDNARDLAIINDINTPKGHLCSRIDSVSISININATLIRFPDISRRFMIYLGSKRILIPLRIRYIDA